MHALDDQPRLAPPLADRTQEGLHGHSVIAGVISSARLLLGQSSVTIDHEGTQYVLRATRAGKLILTK